eukprot:2980365-Amphidinium_carterae.1
MPVAMQPLDGWQFACDGILVASNSIPPSGHCPHITGQGAQWPAGPSSAWAHGCTCHSTTDTAQCVKRTPSLERACAPSAHTHLPK